MLKTRVITALVLLAVLLVVLFAGSFPLFVVATAVFFGAAAWECFRLFRHARPVAGGVFWALAFALIALATDVSRLGILFLLCVAIWVFRLGPSLAIGLPRPDSFANRILSRVYAVAILGCFVAIAALFRQSPVYLLSVMAIVWVADIGAYFSGKAFGRHKIAPAISPGKSWEGAIGGWLAVLVIAAASTFSPLLTDTFPSRLLSRWGWGGLMAVMTILVVCSIAGDLFESQLKRRAGMKDSSNLLPGHGGVLDRIDALIPVLPLAALISLWLT